MIDLRLLREDPDRVRDSQRSRGESPGLVDALLAADAARRGAIGKADALRAEQKALGKRVQKAAAEERRELLNRARELAGDVKAAEAVETATEEALREAHLAVSNVVEGAPPGGEDDYIVVREVGTIPAFETEIRDHVELGALLGAIDVDRAAKVSGSRFYYLTGPGAMLQFALLNVALEQALAAGFRPVIPPVLVRPEAMEGTGFLGPGSENVYAVDDLYLVGTSEVPLAAYHMGEVLDGGRPPVALRRLFDLLSSGGRLVRQGHSAASSGCTSSTSWRCSLHAAEDAADEHQRLLAWEEQFLGALGLPYRVIDVAAGDLGASAARKFDCEAWIPTQGRYREVTSTSNCTDFQARRLGIRFRGKDGRSPVPRRRSTARSSRSRGSSSRILENFQQADGSVVVPPALRPWLGGREVLTPLP